MYSIYFLRELSLALNHESNLIWFKGNLVNKSIFKSFKVNTFQMELSEKEFVSISGILNWLKKSKQIINVRESFGA